MKKTYTKPYIAAESFQLNAAIASSCSSEGKQPLGFYEQSCNLAEEIPTLGYFGVACVHNVTKPGADDNDGICYHGPTPDTDFALMFMNS